MRSRSLLCVLAIWLLASLPGPSRAQPMATADTLHALVVLVRFQDDTEPGDPVLNARGWPLTGDDTLPDFARHLLARSPTPPFPNSSLTAYLHRQSLGQFVLTGTVIDSVLISQHPEARYHRPDGGYGYLTREVLDRLDRAGLDFRRFDRNGDGRLDYLFMIIRCDSQRDAKRFTWTGISCLDARCGGGIAGGRPPGDLVYDGVEIDWQRSGSILMHRTPGNILPHYYHVRLMAHELGHDLWAPFFTHIRAITTNDVPQQSNRTARSTNTVGYVLMAGAGGGWDARGDETISAFERDLLGWIRCDTLTTAQDGVRLGDLYTTSDCAVVPLSGERRLYVTNRQRLGPFDRLRQGGNDGRFEMGLLRTTGLLVHLADGTRLDVLPADNTLDLAPTNAPYLGDLYGPGTKTQLTPWTRPATGGFTHYPPDVTPDWQALDRIRNADDGSGAMLFDVVPDIRERPIIRAASWMGEETHGTTFDAPVIVTRGATLHVETMLSLAGGLVVEPGGTVVVESEGDVRLPPESTLRLHHGSTLVVDGRLDVRGTLRLSPGAQLRRGEGTIYFPTGR